MIELGVLVFIILLVWVVASGDNGDDFPGGMA